MTALETEQQQSAVEVQKCEAGMKEAEEKTINQEETAVETPQAEMEEEHHPTKDEIDEYEESQRKFRELWEKKREKVSKMLILYFLLFGCYFFICCKFMSEEFSRRRYKKRNFLVEYATSNMSLHYIRRATIQGL